QPVPATTVRQLDEQARLWERIRGDTTMSNTHGVPQRSLVLDLQEGRLQGELALPEGSEGLVVFAHGSGSSRFSPRNQQVARYFNDLGLGTLLLDLLTEDEQDIDEATREFRFDILLLARRLVAVIDFLAQDERLQELAVGLFGASTGA